MNDGEILYINHGEDKKNSAGTIDIEHKDNESIITETKDNLQPKQEQTTVIPETTEQKTEEEKTTEAPKATEISDISEAPKDPVATRETEESEIIEETSANTEPLDKIDQITSSTSSLPLPSEETEGIDPLLPY